MTVPCSLHPLGALPQDPYNPGTLILYQTGEYTYRGELPKGVYKICLVSAGGTGTYWIAGGMGYAESGGTGAVVELTFFNPKKQNIELYAPPALDGYGSKTGGNASMKLGADTVIVVYGGKGAGAGGTYTVNTNLLVVVSVQIEKNGNAGRSGFSGSVKNPSISPYKDWGFGNEASSGAGGIRLEYIRLRP